MRLPSRVVDEESLTAITRLGGDGLLLRFDYPEGDGVWAQIRAPSLRAILLYRVPSGLSSDNRYCTRLESPLLRAGRSCFCTMVFCLRELAISFPISDRSRGGLRIRASWRVSRFAITSMARLSPIS